MLNSKAAYRSPPACGRQLSFSRRLPAQCSGIGQKAPPRVVCGTAVERPVEPPAKVRLRDLGHQFNQLRTGEMLPQLLKQPVIHVRRCSRHGNGQSLSCSSVTPSTLPSAEPESIQAAQPMIMAVLMSASLRSLRSTREERSSSSSKIPSRGADGEREP